MTRQFGGLHSILMPGFIAAAVFGCSTLSAAPRIIVTPTSLGAIYVPGGTNGAARTAEVFNAGDGTLNLTATTSAAWLSATTAPTQPCSTHVLDKCIPIVISMNTAALPSGTYLGYVTVSAPGVVDSPAQVPITVTVGSPSNVTLYVPSSGSASINVYPSAAVTATAATASGGNWLTFTSPAGGFNFGIPYAITVSALPGQAPGTYQGGVTIRGSNVADTQGVRVTMVVTNGPIVSPAAPGIGLTGVQAGPVISSTITLNNTGGGTLIVSGASISGSTTNFLSAAVSGNTIQVVADPSLLAPGTYNANIGIASNASNNAQVSIPVQFTVLSAGQPTISQGGIVNIANYENEAVASGDIVALFGDQFAASGANYVNTGAPPLATQLGNVQVLVNGVPAPLYFVSQRQINFQMPYTVQTNQVATVQVVSNGSAGNTRSVRVSPVMARILAWPAGTVAGNYGMIVNADGTLSWPSTGAVGSFKTRPSKPGDSVVVYGVGFGQTGATATAGAASTSSPFQTVANVTATVGGVSATVSITPVFAGLTPTTVGLYQVNITLPANVQTGSNVPMTFNINGSDSNTVTIAISSN